MRVAGVRLDGGGVVWADARDLTVSPLDRVTVRSSDGESGGWVFVTPDQLLQPPERIDGAIVEAQGSEADDDDCAELPGADMPPLGSRVRIESAEGLVIAIDAVRSLVTLRLDDASEVVVSPAQYQ